MQVVRSWTEARRQPDTCLGPGARPAASLQLLPAVDRLVADEGGRWVAAVGPAQVHIFDLATQQHHARLPLPQVSPCSPQFWDSKRKLLKKLSSLQRSSDQKLKSCIGCLQWQHHLACLFLPQLVFPHGRYGRRHSRHAGQPDKMGFKLDPDTLASTIDMELSTPDLYNNLFCHRSGSCRVQISSSGCLLMYMAKSGRMTMYRAEGFIADQAVLRCTLGLRYCGQVQLQV